MSEQKCPRCFGFRGVPKILHDDPDNPVECSDPFHKEEVPAEPEPSPVIEMPRPQGPPAPQPIALKPKCPSCGAEEALNARPMNFGPIRVLAVFCNNPDCRVYLGFFQILELAPVSMPVAN